MSMVWSPDMGEVVYYDNLDGFWFGNYFPGAIDGGEEGYLDPQVVLDIDDGLSGVNNVTGEAYNRFYFVTAKYWGHIEVDYVVPSVDTSELGLRQDCDGPDYDTGQEVGILNVGFNRRFTCVHKMLYGDKYTIAGDNAKNLHLQNHDTMVNWQITNNGIDFDPVIRIFERSTDTSYTGLAPDLTATSMIFAFTRYRRVLIVELNCATGAVISGPFLYSMETAVGDFGPDEIPDHEEVCDVCANKASSMFVIKTSHDLFFMDWLLGMGAALHIAKTDWDVRGNYEMLAMEFINDDYVLIMGDQNLSTWYKVPSLRSTAVAGTLTDVDNKYYDMRKWTHCIPYENELGAILIGVHQEIDEVHDMRQPRANGRVGIFKADLTPGAAITPVLLYELESRGDETTTNWYPWWDPTLSSFTHYENAGYPEEMKQQGEVYRGWRRWGTNEMWLVTTGRQDFLLSVGERLTSPVVTAAGETSTTNKVCWEPVVQDERMNVAWQVVERADECDSDYYCVWASDDSSICCYNDNQNPDVGPVQRIDSDTDMWVEVGLVTQADIHDYDPRLDDWPSGRTFYYKHRRVSWLNIESDSTAKEATTKIPIQPVQISDNKDKKTLDYTDIDVTSRDFTLKWDWTPLGSTPAADFLMWQVAMFEDQNPTIWQDANWGPLAHYPYPWDYTWRWILPWNEYDVKHPLRCFVDGVNFSSSEKTRVVDRKYMRWFEDISTEATDKLYSPLLPDTPYTLAVIGWDKGGLWRASGKMTHVPPSPEDYANEEMTIDRQILTVRTKSEVRYVAVCEFDNPGNETFQRWDDYLNPPLNDFMLISVADPAVGQEFFVEYEVELSQYSFYIEAINGNPGVLTVALYYDDGVNNVPATMVVGSDVAIPQANVAVGWNNVTPAAPVMLRPGRYYFVLSIVGAGGSYQLRCGWWPGETGHHGGWSNGGGNWFQYVGYENYVRLKFSTDTISEGFVTESGELLTFGFIKSTVTDGDEVIFEDNCYAEENLWDVVSGDPTEYTYVGGRMDIDTNASNTSLYMLGLSNDNYGIETRDVLIKARVQYPENEDSTICFIIHEQAPYEVNIDSRGYWICYDIVNGVVTLSQYRRWLGSNEWWDNSEGGIAFPDVPASDHDVWFDIWIKVVDDTISVFVAKDGRTVEENYEAGDSVVHQTIWRNGTDFYDFSHYGYFMFMIPRDNAIRIDYIKIFGKYSTSGLGTGQGPGIIYGDDSDSGYRATYEIEKIYSVEPDDDTEQYDAEIWGIDQYGNSDLGFVPAWLDYPTEIAQDDYDRQIFVMNIDNAEPVAVLNVGDIGYTGVLLSMDGIGSSDPEGGDLTYYWNFGDGTSDTTTNPFSSHTYSSVGTYTVSLYVQDEMGLVSETVFATVEIITPEANFVLVEFNHPIYAEEMSRESGTSSQNIPDKCGSEVQDGGPGSRVFNIAGLHAPPQCCCGDTSGWRLALDLEFLCESYTYYEEYNEESVCECDVILYQSPDQQQPPANLYVGQTAPGTVYQQANIFMAGQYPENEICGISLFVTDTTMVNSSWLVQVSIQDSSGVGGQPGGVALASGSILASSLVMGAWNKFEFGLTIQLIPGTTYWIVVEPVPCPPLVETDYIQVQYTFIASMTNYQLTPMCISTCVPNCPWAPTADEIQVILWGPNEYCPPPVPVPQCDCDVPWYISPEPFNDQIPVGLVDGIGVYNAGSKFTVVDPVEVCGLSLMALSKDLSTDFTVHVEIQEDDGTGNAPTGINLISGDLLASTINDGVWNLFDFGTSLVLPPGVYWVVATPVPCPPDGPNNNVLFGTVAGGTMTGYFCSPECTPICAWVPIGAFELMCTIWECD